MDFFGDSYDVVKRYLLGTLAPDAVWRAFPMFTHDATHQQVADLEAFLRVKVAAPDALTRLTNRAAHLQADVSWTHVFLDPDTGVRLDVCGGEASTRYVFGLELIGLCRQRPDRLVLVFDQSVPRGRERESMEAKLSYFREREVVGFAYRSHACFLVLSATQSVVDAARGLLVASNLPASRLVPELC